MTINKLRLGEIASQEYTQEEIKNINTLLRFLKNRLNSSFTTQVKSQNDENITLNNNVFSTEELVTCLEQSLSCFNQLPIFSFYTFKDTDFINQFVDILVQGATIVALSSKALIERGREFQISDNGVQFTPPSVSEILMSQYKFEFNKYYEKLKEICMNIKIQNKLCINFIFGVIIKTV